MGQAPQPRCWGWGWRWHGAHGHPRGWGVPGAHDPFSFAQMVRIWPQPVLPLRPCYKPGSPCLAVEPCPPATIPPPSAWDEGRAPLPPLLAAEPATAGREGQGVIQGVLRGYHGAHDCCDSIPMLPSCRGLRSTWGHLNPCPAARRACTHPSHTPQPAGQAPGPITLPVLTPRPPHAHTPSTSTSQQQDTPTPNPPAPTTPLPAPGRTMLQPGAQGSGPRGAGQTGPPGGHPISELPARDRRGGGDWCQQRRAVLCNVRARVSQGHPAHSSHALHKPQPLHTASPGTARHSAAPGGWWGRGRRAMG